jgi:hypothetical protein
MDIRLHPIDHVFAQILPHPEFEVDQAVVIIVIGIIGELDSEAFDRCFDALFQEYLYPARQASGKPRGREVTMSDFPPRRPLPSQS